MITQTYKIDMIPNGAPVVVHVSQYDKDARTLAFELYSGGVTYTPAGGSSAYIRGTKPDATVFVYPMTIAGNVATITLAQQMALVAGNVPCEVQIVDSDGTINSANFILHVEQGAIDESVTPSATELPIFEQLVQDAEAARDAAVIAEGNAETAETGAVAAKDAAVALIPAGGTAGQYLQKTANGTQWATTHEVPAGGTTGQVLTKTSNADYATAWQNGGGGGGGDLYITITGVNPPTANKTFAEIEACIAADGTPIVTDNSAYYHMAAYTAGSSITFEVFIPSGRKRFVIDSANTVTYTFTANTATAANVSYSNTTTGYVATNVQAAIDETAQIINGHMITKTVTLAAGSWVSNEYTITDADIPASTGGNVTLTMPNAANTTDLLANITAFRQADIYAYNQVAGAITLYANGSAPTTNMDIVLIIEQ